MLTRQLRSFRGSFFPFPFSEPSHPSTGSLRYGSQSNFRLARTPPNKAMKSDVEKRGSNFRCTVLASTFLGSAESVALFNAAYR